MQSSSEDHITSSSESNGYPEDNTFCWIGLKQPHDPTNDPFAEDMIVVDIRLTSRGSRKTTIIEGLPGHIDLKGLLSKLNKEFHCSGGIVEDKKPFKGSFRKHLKLTGDQRDGAKRLLISSGIPRDCIKLHGV